MSYYTWEWKWWGHWMRNHDLKHLPVAIVSTWRAERLWSESPFGGPVSHWCAGDGSFCIFGFSSFWVKQIKHVNEDRLTFLFSSDSASRIGAFPLSFDETGWVRVEVGKIGYSFIPECIKIASTVGWVSVPGWSVIFRLVVPELFFLSFLAWPAPATEFSQLNSNMNPLSQNR